MIEYTNTQFQTNTELVYEMSFLQVYHCLFGDGNLQMENNFNSTNAIIVSFT